MRGGDTSIVSVAGVVIFDFAAVNKFGRKVSSVAVAIGVAAAVAIVVVVVFVAVVTAVVVIAIHSGFR